MLKRNREFFLFWIIFGFLLVFAALRPIGFDSDSIGYIDWIERDAYKDMAEPSFSVIVWFWSLLVPEEYISRMVLVTYAGFNMFVLKYAIEGFSNRRTQAFIFYFLFIYFIFTLTQIRIGLAGSVFLWALVDLMNDRKKSFLFKMMLAISFHYMMFIFIPFYFINSDKRPTWYFLIVIIVSLLAGLFTSNIFIAVTDMLFSFDLLPVYIASKLLSYLQMEGVDIAVFNFHLAFVLLIYVLALAKSSSFNRIDFFLLKCVSYGIILYFLTSFMTTMSGRVLNIVVMMCIVLIPGVCRGWRGDSALVFCFISTSAFLLFLNTHVRNNLLDFGVIF